MIMPGAVASGGVVVIPAKDNKKAGEH